VQFYRPNKAKPQTTNEVSDCVVTGFNSDAKILCKKNKRFSCNKNSLLLFSGNLEVNCRSAI
jgi:hypothetical protein